MAESDTPSRGHEPPDDPSVIALVLDGNIDQFAVIVERYQAGLYRHALSLVLDHDTAADMVQEAFVRAYTHLASCRDRARFRGWLFQTLRNRCLDHLKEAQRRNVPLDRAEHVVDRGEGPDAMAERVRLGGAIGAALAALPAAQREAFVMHYVEGFAYDEMGDLLGVSVSALKMRVLRAREALASALSQTDVTDSLRPRLSIERS